VSLAIGRTCPLGLDPAPRGPGILTAMAKTAARKSPYSIHPAYRMEDAYRKNLKERTGKSYEEWIRIAKRDGPEGATAKRAWLRKEHGLSSNYAWWVAQGAEGEMDVAAKYDPEGMVEELFSGPRAALRPIYDALLRMGLGLGEDVKACPCKTMVPLYRKYVFAEIKPTTQTRVDLGLALGDAKPAGRLEKATDRYLDDRISHRIPITSPDEIDAEVERWLRAAYARGDEAQKRRPAADPDKVPADLAKALTASSRAKDTFASLTPRAKSEWIAFVTTAKQADTRARRVARAAERLGSGKKTIY